MMVELMANRGSNYLTPAPNMSGVTLKVESNLHLFLSRNIFYTPLLGDMLAFELIPQNWNYASGNSVLTLN